MEFLHEIILGVPKKKNRKNLEVIVEIVHKK